MQTYTWDRSSFPRATVTFDGGVYEAVLDGVEGLNPQRSTSASERIRGLVSLDPPTARSRDVDELVDLAVEAFDVAVASTLGDTGKPGDYLMVRYRAAVAVRGALEGLEVDA